MKFSVITTFFASITSSIPLPPFDKPTFPRLKRLHVVPYYKDPVLRKLRSQKLYKERQQQSLVFGKPPEPACSFRSKKVACAAAVSLGQSQTTKLPPKFLADNYNLFNDIQKAALQYVNTKRQLKNKRAHLTGDVTALELVDFLNNTPDTDFAAIRASHKGFELCMLPVDWLDIMDSARCVSKQTSRYASIHSPEHKASLDAIDFTRENCALWLPVLLRQRCSAKIHSFRLGRKGFRVRYELAIPLDSPGSQVCKEGKAGSNKNNPHLAFITYTLVLEYEKDPNQGAYLKIGKLITGFVRRTKYSQRDMDCIKFLIPEAKPLSGCVSNVTQLQPVLKHNPFIIGLYSPTKVLKLVKPISPAQEIVRNDLKTLPLTGEMISVLENNDKYIKITEKLFGQIARTITIENNKNVRIDFP